MIPYFATPKASISLLKQGPPLLNYHSITVALMPPHRPAVRLQAGCDFQTPPPDDEGNPDVQDALINMIKLEIGKKNVGILVGNYFQQELIRNIVQNWFFRVIHMPKESPPISSWKTLSPTLPLFSFLQVEEYVEESGDKLKDIADEAKEEMERLAELTKMRGDVAFDSALADINKEADEFAEQLRKSREEQAAKDAEFDNWEVDINASRSEGQFFKNLYQTDKKKPLGESVEKMKQKAQRVIEPARQEIRSPIRFYLFLVLGFLLAADAGADLASSEPSLGQDVLYLGLCALAVWLAINEKRALK